MEYQQRLQTQITNRDKAKAYIKNKSFDTIATHGVYDLNEALANQGSVIEPVFMSTAQGFSHADELQAALAYEIPSWSYTRIHNPTLYYLESTLALLESYDCGVEAGCCVTSSGMSAITTVTDALLADSPHANFVSSSQIYGGSFQQFSIRQAQKNRQVRWVAPDAPMQSWAAQIDENTRFIYIEVPSNPGLAMCDIEMLAGLAHANNIPLIVDATLATPALIRPFQFGADIVIHSLSKIIAASGSVIGGAIIAKENITARFLPDDVSANFCQHLKLLPNRDNGACLSPMQAFLVLSELRTLRMRVDAFSQNTLKVAQFLQGHPKVEQVLYPGLLDYPQYQLAQKYFELVDSAKNSLHNQPEKRYGHLLSFRVKDGVQAAKQVINNLRLIFCATDLGRVKTIATIPAISTHQQQGDKGRQLANIPDNLIRLSVGAENADDIIQDLDQALGNHNNCNNNHHGNIDVLQRPHR
ncbi:aminotransferase class I/II-fold pyridoxal phosphate-dependent enzyme [Facilibium subflavum]|uniref:aminotransferase class I/II-fold pyridoxal phosphate-dependent enzyme n=1 Tax=Facilibium subflavum TaxID=2219058 RepID=UPI001F3A76E2|nr:aminotransferase class I/II-fold pyridoxal phosphate-dependent enzyme [Facilibium subflavum]